MFLLPDQYFETPISTLLVEVSKGRIPFDHRLIRVLLGRQDETALAIAQTKPDDWRFDITAELIDLSRAMRDARVLPFLMKQLEDDPDETVFDAFRVLGRLTGTDLWQLHWSGQTNAENTSEDRIANLRTATAPPVGPNAPAVLNPPAGPSTPAGPNPPVGPNAAPDDSGFWIKLVARADGTFSVTNARNGFRKTYGATDGDSARAR